MLQQTQVARVVPAYEAFVAAYPDPASLAAAGTDQVIAAWGDLGYLRRATNLRRAAEVLSTAGWPDDLTALPGVGPYTAAAVGAFAFGHRTAAVDINLRRVLSRWTGRVLDPGPASDVGDRLVDPDRPGDWNQAMMDLGATICRPSEPACGECPVAEWCDDPSIRVRTRRQTPFEGSRRQARAAVLKLLATGPSRRDGLADRLELDPTLVESAVDALTSEGLIRADGSTLELAR